MARWWSRVLAILLMAALSQAVANTLWATPVTPAPSPTPPPKTAPTNTPPPPKATPVATPTRRATPVPVSFDRRLGGDQVTQHQTLPSANVKMTVAAQPRGAVSKAVLSDYFPAVWQVVDAGGGEVIPASSPAEANRIFWPVGDLKAGQRVSKSYVVQSPQIPGDFTFHSELAFTQGTAVSDKWLVTVVESLLPRVSHYRIGQDEALDKGHEDSYYLAPVDAPAKDIRRGVNFRIRFQVYREGKKEEVRIHEGPGLEPDYTWQPQLEWSADPKGGWAPVPTSWDGGPFLLAESRHLANEEGYPFDPHFVDPAHFGLGPGSGKPVPGVVYNAQNPPAKPPLLEPGYYTEVEFNIRAAPEATPGQTYYFRVTDGGAALPDPPVTAAVTIQAQPASRPRLSPAYVDPHKSYVALEDACAACHRGHSASGRELRKTWPEEQVCFGCHDGTGSNTNIYTLYTTASYVYTHPVTLTQTTGVHKLGERDLGSNWNTSGPARHVECEDCHNPHNARPPTHTAGSNAASGVISGTWGVTVSYGATAWVPPVSSTVVTLTYEWQLCFKCHSSYAYTTTPPDAPSAVGWVFNSLTLTDTNQTDQSVEFNSNNYGYHPIITKGKNNPGAANPDFDQTFVSPWTSVSTVQCGDCHGAKPSTEPGGPHASNNRFMLRNNETGYGPLNLFCFNCHLGGIYDGTYTTKTYSRASHPISTPMTNATANRWGIWCMNCHGGDGMFGTAQGTRGGGIHGSNRGTGSSGTTEVGKRMLNGAGILGWTAATTATNSGKGYTKGAADAISTCTGHVGGKNWTANYNYAP